MLFYKAKLPSSFIDESSDQLLAKKKEELKQIEQEIPNLVTATKSLTSELIDKLKKESTRFKLALQNTLDEHYDKGILFLTNAGDILFANKLIVDWFNVPMTKLVNAKVTQVKIGSKLKRFSELDIRKLLGRRSHDKPRGLTKLTSCFLKAEDKICSFVLSTDEVLGPFNGDIVLLDPSPKTVDDAIFIVYIDGKKEAAEEVASRGPSRGG
jgi:hypothetical protein